MLPNSDDRLMDRRGFVLVVALLLLLLFSILGISAIGISTSEISISGNQKASEEAFYAAVAGMNDAIRRLKTKAISDAGHENDTAWSWPDQTTGFNNTFTVTHLVIGSPSAVAKTSKGNPYYLVQSTGISGTAQNKLEALVSFDLALSNGVCGCDKVTISGGGMVDSFNSKSGTYASQATHTDAENNPYAGGTASVYTTNTSGNVSISGGSIHGDVKAAGTYSGGAHIYGALTQGVTASACDPVGVTALVKSADPSAGVTPGSYNGNPLTIDASSGVLNYKDFTVSGGKTATITGSGPVKLYIEGNMTLSGGSRLLVSSGINLTIYIGGDLSKGDLSISGGGIVNLNGDPTTLTIYSSANNGKVDISGDSAFYGLVYAPLANVTMSGGSDFFGAVRGKTVTQSSGSGRFHYDEAVGGGSSNGYQVVYWRRVLGS